RRGDRKRGGDPRTRRRLEPESEIVVPRSRRSRSASARIHRAHAGLALRLRNIPHERRALGAAELYVPARHDTTTASYRRDHHRPDAPLHGASVLRRPDERVVGAADRGALDSIHTRRVARACRAARRKLVLSARRPGAAGRSIVGCAPRAGGRSHDRNRQSLRAELQGRGARAADHEPARPRAYLWLDRWGHLSRRVESRSAVLRAADARVCGLPIAVARLIYVRIRYASGRRRHRCTGPQRRTRNRARFQKGPCRAPAWLSRRVMLAILGLNRARNLVPRERFPDLGPIRCAPSSSKTGLYRARSPELASAPPLF